MCSECVKRELLEFQDFLLDSCILHCTNDWLLKLCCGDFVGIVNKISI